jgi:hypothetical protein
LPEYKGTTKQQYYEPHQVAPRLMEPDKYTAWAIVDETVLPQLEMERAFVR